jgi:predicted PurR-regulated permease PerM
MAAGPDLPGEHWKRRWPPVRYWIEVAVGVALALFVLAAAEQVRNILVLVVIALVIAVGLDPAVRRLQRLRIGRGAAVALIFLGMLLFVGAFVALIGPPLVRQVADLAGHVPSYVEKLGGRQDPIGRYVREHDVAAATKDFVADLPARIASSFDTILGVAGRVGSMIFNLITAATLSIYFLVSLPSLRHSAGLLFAPAQRERGERLIGQSVSRIGGYVSGNLITSAVCAVCAMVALLITRVPFAVPLGMWAGVADLIPQVGAYLGAAPAVLIGLIDSPVQGVVVLAYFVVYQQFENYVLAPRVMRQAVDLSPAAVIISTLIGGSLLGFAGALLALPITATLKVVLTEVWLRPREEEGMREEAARLAQAGVPPAADPAVPTAAVPPAADPVVPSAADPAVPPAADPVVPSAADPAVPSGVDPAVPPAAAADPAASGTVEAAGT